LACSRGPAETLNACVLSIAIRTDAAKVLKTSCLVACKAVMIEILDVVSFRELTGFYIG